MTRWDSALLGLVSGLLLASTAVAQAASDDESEAGQVNAALGGSAAVRKDKSDSETDEDAGQAACGAGSMAVTSGGCGKRWRLIGYTEYSQLVVTDNDPANDAQATAWVQGSYRLLTKHNVLAWSRVGFTQLFTAEAGERGARFNDALLGADYLHSVPFEGWEGRALNFQHRLFAALPTSRDSQNVEMRTALTLLERFRLNPMPYIFTGVDLIGGYRFHKYAEEPGPGGAPLPRANFDGVLVAEVYPFSDKPYGSLLVGASAGVGATRTYEDRNPDPTLSGDSVAWNQRYNWSTYLYYLPTSYLWMGVSLGHGVPLLRDGVRRVSALDRDLTQMAFSMIAIL